MVKEFEAKATPLICSLPKTTFQPAGANREHGDQGCQGSGHRAAIDGTTLSDILKKASESGAKVIAYDRLIRDSGNVDYYSTFDNFKVGVLQAESLVAGLKERFPNQKP